jgi:hypothetical protein
MDNYIFTSFTCIKYSNVDSNFFFYLIYLMTEKPDAAHK